MIMEYKDRQWKAIISLLRKILSPEPIFPPRIRHGAVQSHTGPSCVAKRPIDSEHHKLCRQNYVSLRPEFFLPLDLFHVTEIVDRN